MSEGGDDTHCHLRIIFTRKGGDLTEEDSILLDGYLQRTVKIFVKKCSKNINITATQLVTRQMAFLNIPQRLCKYVYITAENDAKPVSDVKRWLFQRFDSYTNSFLKTYMVGCYSMLFMYNNDENDEDLYNNYLLNHLSSTSCTTFSSY